MCVWQDIHLAMAARPAGSNPPALKIKLKPRKESLPVTTTSQQIASQSHSVQPIDQDDARVQQFDGETARTELVVKRKLPSPASSPTSAKRVARDEGSPLVEPRVPLSASGEPLEVLPGHCEQLAATEPLVFKQQICQPHTSVASLVYRDQALQVPAMRVEEEDTSRPSNKFVTSNISLENISHGQLQVISVIPTTNQDDDPFLRYTADALVHQQVYPFPWARPAAPQNCLDRSLTVIPSHASWFSWERIHKLERQALPQLFYGKSKLPSPEVYVQARNAIIMKYRANAGTCLGMLDIHGLNNLEEKDLAQMLSFLSHWGLVNYQAEAKLDTRGYKFPTKVPVYLEDEQGSLHVTPLPLMPLECLYQFEPLLAPTMDSRSLATANDEPSVVVAENVVKEAQGTAQNSTTGSCCSACAALCPRGHYVSEKQADYFLCTDCFSDGKLGIGMTTLDFTLLDGPTEATEPSDNSTWTDHETLTLLEAIEIYGDNWTEISEFVGTKSKAQCLSHFIGLPIEDRFFEDMEIPRAFITVGSRQSQPGFPSKTLLAERLTSANKPEGQAVSELEKAEPRPEAKLNTGVEEQRNAGVYPIGGNRPRQDVQLAFSEAANPVMSLVSFLAATVGPRVAAAAAHTALLCLAEDHQAFQNAVDLRIQNAPANSTPAIDVTSEPNKGDVPVAIADNNHTGSDGGRGERSEILRRMLRNHHWPSRGLVKRATSAALATAAMKAKMLADQEEREVQRLAAIIVDNQFKKLGVKVKQLEDIDPVLERECDQIDKNRQRFCAERIRFLSSRAGLPTQMPGSVNAMSPSVVRASGPSGVPPSVSTADANHPMGLLRPMLYTLGPNGMPIAVSSSSAKPPS